MDPTAANLDDTSLWKERLPNKAFVGFKDKMRWYSKNDTTHPAFKDFIRSQRTKKQQTKQVRALKLENASFSEKLKLGLDLSFQCLDESNYLLLRQLIEPDMPITDLEDLLMRSPNSLNRKWLGQIVSQVTDNSYCVVDDILTLVLLDDIDAEVELEEASDIDDVSNTNGDHLEKLENVSLLSEPISVIQINPACTDTEPPELGDIDMFYNNERSIYTFRKEDKVRRIFNYKYPLFCLKPESINNVSNARFIQIGVSAFKNQGSNQVNLDMWNAWSLSARQRFIKSPVLFTALNSTGLQLLAARSLLTTTLENSFVSYKFKRKAVDLLKDCLLSDANLQPE